MTTTGNTTRSRKNAKSKAPHNETATKTKGTVPRPESTFTEENICSPEIIPGLFREFEGYELPLSYINFIIGYSFQLSQCTARIERYKNGFLDAMTGRKMPDGRAEYMTPINISSEILIKITDTLYKNYANIPKDKKGLGFCVIS